MSVADTLVMCFALQAMLYVGIWFGKGAQRTHDANNYTCSVWEDTPRGWGRVVSKPRMEVFHQDMEEARERARDRHA